MPTNVSERETLDRLEPPETRAAHSLRPPAVPGYTVLELVGLSGDRPLWRAERADGTRVVLYIVGAGSSLRYEHLLALVHARLPTVLERGEVNGSPYIAFEDTAGQSLQSLVDLGTLSLQRSLEMMAELAATLTELGCALAEPRPEDAIVTSDGRVCLDPLGWTNLINRVTLGEAAAPDLQQGTQNDALTPGTRIGRFSVLERIGQGGMAVVYAAFDAQLGRRVAIKLVRSDRLVADGPQRLLREAQAMAKLAHPNVVTVHDVGVHANDVFIAMELVEGTNVAGWLKATPRSVAQILDVFLDAGEGLVAAHAAGLVHRDFKPHNILIGHDGRVRVSDFGIVRAEAAATPPAQPESPSSPAAPPSWDVPLTWEGDTPGTPEYMAPEQFHHAATDARSDQFSFCVALYEALAGQRPFGETARGLGPRAAVPRPLAMSRALYRVLSRGLRASPEERFPNMGALLRALRRASPKSNRWRSVGLGVAGLLSLLGLAYVALSPSGTRCEADSKLAGLWDAPRKERIREAFERSRLAYAQASWRTTERVLDAYTDLWRKGYVDACEARHVRGEQAPEAYDLRVRCLEDRLDELRALTDILADADASVVERTPSGLLQLPNVTRCRDVAELRQARRRAPVDERGESVGAEARAALAKAWGAELTGRAREGIVHAERALKLSSGVRHRVLEARALELLGWLQAEAGELERGAQTLTAATFVADATEQDALGALAAVKLIFITADRLKNVEEGRRWASAAEAKLERLLGANPHEVAATATGASPHAKVLGLYFNNRGTLLLAEGDAAGALRELELALKVDERAHGKRHRGRPFILNNVSVAYVRLGRLEEGASAMRECLDLVVEHLGAAHPFAAQLRVNLGENLALRGELTAALALFSSSLSVFREVHGAEHPFTAYTLERIGAVAYDLKQYTLAERSFREALEMHERRGAAPRGAAVALAGLGRTRFRMGHREEAVKLLTESFDAGLEHHDDPRGLAQSRFVLALGLASTAGGRQRARALSTTALAELQRLTSAAADAEEVRRWLAQPPSP